ncbi:CDP-glycerol glycerophosphotransferase family protein [Luedemannella helvata]|uniref:CDP-glycerol glycerophosphotransferase family protein n=1 Tax=Luedemannella helvata TaxID=349315 RepID=A0ABN2KNS6_9ACTN
MIKQAFQRFLGPVTANLLAVLAFVIAVGTSWRWVTLALVTATLAVTVLYRDGNGLGRYLVSRALVAGGVLAAFIRFLPAEVDWAFNISAALTLGYISMETVLNRVSLLPMDSRHLRVSGRPLSWLVNATVVFYADCALVALFALAPIIELQSWLALVAVIAVGLLHSALALESIYTKTYRSAGRDDIIAALTRYQPEFLIHWDAPAASVRQVEMWLPYLERVGARFAIVVRRRRNVDVMAGITNRPVVLASSISDVDAVMAPSLKAVFYVNNGAKNTHTVRFAELTHVQLLHGDSEKQPSYNPITAMFDEIWVAGQAGQDRYAQNGVDIPAGKFRIVGRPQVENVKVVRTPISEIKHKVVLYAPTWIGYFGDTNHCSLAVGHKILKALLARPDVTVIMRHHQLTTKNAKSAAQLAELERILAKDRAATKRKHLWGDATSAGEFVDWANKADAMIADVSSVVSDFLYSEKPFAVTDMLNEGDQMEASARIFGAAYQLRHDMSNVAEVVGHLLGDDPKAEIRQQLKAYYLGDFPTERYADGFVEQARRTLTRPTMGEVLNGVAPIPTKVVMEVKENDDDDDAESYGRHAYVISQRSSVEDEEFSTAS